MAIRITTTTSTAGVSPLVTKGLGSTKFRIVTQGYGPVGLVIQRIISITRGGRTALKDLYGDKVEEFNIAAKLVAIDGKDLLNPIINKGRYIIKEIVGVTVRTLNLSVNQREEQKTKVSADIIKVKRGSDGNNWLRFR